MISWRSSSPVAALTMRTWRSWTSSRTGVRAWVRPMPMWWRRPLTRRVTLPSRVDAVVPDAVVVVAWCGGGGLGAGLVGHRRDWPGRAGTGGGAAGWRRPRTGPTAARGWTRLVAGGVGRRATAFGGLLEPFDLAGRWWAWSGGCCSARRGGGAARPPGRCGRARPPATRVVKTIGLSVNVEAGVPKRATAPQEAVAHDRAGHAPGGRSRPGRRGGGRLARLRTSASPAGASWGRRAGRGRESACQHWFGSAAWNRW